MFIVFFLVSIMGSFLFPSVLAACELAKLSGAPSSEVELQVQLHKDNPVWQSGRITIIPSGFSCLLFTYNSTEPGQIKVHVSDSNGMTVESGSFSTAASGSMEISLKNGVAGEFVQIEMTEGQDITLGKLTLYGLPSLPQPFQVVGVSQFESPSQENTDISSPVALLLTDLHTFLPDGILTNRPERTKTVPCTGFLVKGGILLTASHCLPGLTKEEWAESCASTVALFGYSRTSTNSIQAAKCFAILYFNPVLDVALIGFKEKVEIGHLEIDSKEPVIGSTLKILQHPEGMIQVVSRDADCKIIKSVSPINVSRNGITTAEVKDLGFAHGCDTMFGSSGAPILEQSEDGDWRVQGFHVGWNIEEPRKENFGVPISNVLKCIQVTPEGEVIKSSGSENISFCTKGEFDVSAEID